MMLSEGKKAGVLNKPVGCSETVKIDKNLLWEHHWVNFPSLQCLLYSLLTVAVSDVCPYASLLLWLIFIEYCATEHHVSKRRKGN